MPEGQEGAPQSESTKTPEQGKNPMIREFGERSEDIMKMVHERMFGGKSFEDLVNELDNAAIRKKVAYKDACYIRKGAGVPIPEFYNYDSASVIQGIVAGQNNKSRLPFQPEYTAVVRARDSGFDEVTFKTQEQAMAALQYAVWLWGREKNISLTEYPILEAATRRVMTYYDIEREHKGLSTRSGARLEAFAEKVNNIERYKIPSYSGFKVQP